MKKTRTGRRRASAKAEPVRLRILVVENHPDTLKYLCLYLEQMGHVVIQARSKSESIALLPGSRCDVLISDIGLPDGNGWELLLQAPFPKPPYAIAMSGFGMHADRERSLAAGYRYHLLKPFPPEKLDALLDEAAQEASSRPGRSSNARP
jgi:two-component system CheB/CheR fusion protein